MRITTANRRVWSTAGALLALLACGLARPSTALAGCSHPAGAAPGAGQFERLARAGALATPPRDAPIEPGRPAPCSGVLCSGTPAVPLAPVPIPPVRGVTEAILDPADCMPDPGSTLIAPVDATLRPAHSGPAIFHPPRPATSLPIR